eukprot:CAMPEP_0116111550 /NCGR_PEP_ID=MMETSP0327-20121206/18505_1 /TAXON_ID=44447 /ORGANISM="Pseudo-nitzschia delicatissima, Strain B596" /LENGTH=245 /DNA_ID=CAMNT_0003604789 /DNA_START=1640 /DNA_END=2377 /DNA_ORIENTATION=-
MVALVVLFLLGSTNAFAPGASLNELRTAFPKDASIVAAGGWNNIETLAKSDPKKALVDFVVDGLKSADSAVQPTPANPIRTSEKLEALSLLLYSMGKGFSADAIDGEWDLVYTQQGSKSKTLQKLVGKRETAGKSKNIFDVASMLFHGDVSFWKFWKVSTSVKYTPISEAFSKGMDGKIVVRRIVCKIVNAFFKFWKLPGIPLPRPKKSGFLDIVYLDEDIRVTKGSGGGFFVHFRPAFLKEVLA